jgi:hypothetical protein
MLVEHIASHCLILVKTALVHSKIKFSPYFFNRFWLWCVLYTTFISYYFIHDIEHNVERYQVYGIDEVTALPLTFCTSHSLQAEIHCLTVRYSLLRMPGDQNTIVWPPVQPSHHGNSSIDTANHSNSTAGPPVPLTPHNTSFTAPSTVLTSRKSKKIFQNGFEQSAPKPLAYAPYQPVNRLMSGMGWEMKTKGEVQCTFCVHNIGKLGS